MTNSNAKKVGASRASEKVSDTSYIANFFGFSALELLQLDNGEHVALKDFAPELGLETKFRFLKSYLLSEKHHKTVPAFLCTEDLSKSAYRGDFFVIGASKPIIECVLIHTSVTILKKLGFKNLKVKINTHGDKASSLAFDQKLRQFIKKNQSAFDKNQRQAIRLDQRAVFRHIAEASESYQDLPSTLDFLSEKSREHFKTIIEYLETVGLSYDIESNLVGSSEFATETIFTIVEEHEGKEVELANGWSFHKIGKKGGLKKDVIGSFISIKVGIKKPVKMRPMEKKANYSLVQFGPVAKFKSFLVLDNFLEAGIPIRHSFMIEKLGGQMDAAERNKTGVLVLLGQKEALDNSIVIRELESRHQKVVKIPELQEYFKMI